MSTSLTKEVLSANELTSHRANKLARGFTLLELLIVISIIAILSVILIVALNPAETLKKARDTQRISDLASLKTALGIYITTTTSSATNLGLAGTNLCRDESSKGIYYSIGNDTTSGGTGIHEQIGDTGLDGTTGITVGQVTDANLGLIAGTGWVPVNLSGLTGGSPISNMPIDPINTIADTTAYSAGTVPTVYSADKVYRYACKQSNLTFEIDATLESTAFTSTDDKRAKDGGNSTLMYEVGTDLTILGANNASSGNAAAF